MDYNQFYTKINDNAKAIPLLRSEEELSFSSLFVSFEFSYGVLILPPQLN